MTKQIILMLVLLFAATTHTVCFLSFRSARLMLTDMDLMETMELMDIMDIMDIMDMELTDMPPLKLTMDTMPTSMLQLPPQLPNF